MRHPRLLLLLVAGLLALAGCASPAQPARPVKSATTAPEAPPGQRWVSFGDVIVAVPESWGYDENPGPTWCAGDPERFPSEPYVALPSLYRAYVAIACPSPYLPEQYRTTSVELFASPPPGTKPAPIEPPDGDWEIMGRSLGATTVRITVPTGDEAVGQAILDSMRQVEVDHLGCPVTSPIQDGPATRPAAVDLTTQRDAGPVVVCQYATGAEEGRFGAPGTPGLIASVELTEVDTAGLIDALGQAPTGPEPRLADCPPPSGGALVVRIGDAEVYAHPFSCGSTGWLDTGDRRVTLTPENCAPLFAEPVAFYSADDTVFRACQP